MCTLNSMKYMTNGMKTLFLIWLKNFYHIKRTTILIVSIENKVSWSVKARCSKKFLALSPLNIQSNSKTLVSILFFSPFATFLPHFWGFCHGSSSSDSFKAPSSLVNLFIKSTWTLSFCLCLLAIEDSSESSELSSRISVTWNSATVSIGFLRIFL